jgi:hypothetical protein
VALRAVEIAVTGHATIDTRSCPSSLTGKPEGTIVALGDAIAACRDPDTALPAGPDLHALIVGRVGTFSDAGTRGPSRRLTLFDRSTLESIATRVYADIPAERAVVVGLTKKPIGARVAKRIRDARSGARTSVTNARKTPEVTSRAVHRVGVATLTVHWIAHVLGALISVVAIDSGAQHRVFASPSGAHTRKTTEVTCGAVHHVGVATLTVHWIAHVLGALISVVAIDSGAQHRVFANASSTNARKTPEVAGHPSGHVRVVTLPVCRIAGVRGALVLIIAIDASAQHRVFTGARATHARKTAEVA